MKAAASFGGRRRSRPAGGGGGARNAIAARTIVQVLFSTGKSFTIEGLREKLREWFLNETDGARRAVAALSTAELVTALFELNESLEKAGLQLQVINGTVSLITTPVQNRDAAAYLEEATGQSGDPELTTGSLEVLACVAFKQPITQAEIDRVFSADKRSVVQRLREMRLVEEFVGHGGRFHFVTTAAFLQRFGLESPAQLKELLEQKT